MVHSPCFIPEFTLVSALGVGLDETEVTLQGECHALTRIELSPAGHTYFGNVDVDNVAVPDHVSAYDSECTRLLVMASQQDRFLQRLEELKERFGPRRIACFLGTITGSTCAIEKIYRANPDQRNNHHKIPIEFHGSINQPLEFLRAYLGILGPYATLSTACSSSAKVFATASRYLAAGVCDAVVVAGVEPKCESLIYGFRALGVLSSEPAMPFDKDRNGINIGAACGLAIITREPMGPSDCILRGYGETSDGYHMTAPHPEGAGIERCMQKALQSAGLAPQDIDYINAHGSGTPINDITEDGAIARVFGENVMVSSTKGFMGHTQGAAGIAEAIILMLGLGKGFVPINVNLKERDHKLTCHIVCTPTKKHMRFGLTNSMGFGGNNASLIFGAPQ